MVSAAGSLFAAGASIGVGAGSTPELVSTAKRLVAIHLPPSTTKPFRDLEDGGGWQEGGNTSDFQICRSRIRERPRSTLEKRINRNDSQRLRQKLANADAKNEYRRGVHVISMRSF